MSLDDRQVVVIGSSSGMGLATAKAAAKSGANVTLVSRSPEVASLLGRYFMLMADID